MKRVYSCPRTNRRESRAGEGVVLISKTSTLQRRWYLPYLLRVTVADMEVGKKKDGGKTEYIPSEHFPTLSPPGLMCALCQEVAGIHRQKALAHFVPAYFERTQQSHLNVRSTMQGDGLQLNKKYKTGGASASYILHTRVKDGNGAYS